MTPPDDEPKLTCLNIGCPERTGGKCTATPSDDDVYRALYGLWSSDRDDVSELDYRYREIMALISQKVTEARIEGGRKQLEWVYYQQKINPDDDGIVARMLKDRIATLTTKQDTKEEK
jgi:hypothetical protein